jgi:ATP-binding cassette, subfamily B, bacterial
LATKATTISTPAQPTFWSGWKERVKAMQGIPKVLRLVWDSARFAATMGIVLRVMAALLPVAMAYVTRLIIDSVVAIVSRKGGSAHQLWIYAGVEFGLAIISGLLGRLIDYYDSVLADRYIAHVSLAVMRHASRLDLKTYEDPEFYDRLERARVQATDRLGMIQSMGRLIQQAVTTVFLSAAILWFSPWLLLIMGACLIPAVFGESHFAFLDYAKNFRQTPAKRQLDYLRTLGASKEAAKELKLFGLAGFLTERFSKLSGAICKENLALSRKRLLASLALLSLSVVGYYGAYVYVIYRTVKGDFTIGTLTFLATAIMGASSSLSQMFSTLSSIADQSLFLTDLIAFFAMSPSVRSRPHALPAPRPIRDGFEFRRVSFSYPGTNKPVLKGLNFRISPGERVALIGENGQGKTTIVKLISRLYDPDEGQILLDGVDLREYDIDDLHREIGVVFQDFTKYEMTARENIAVGQIEEIDSQERIREAASKSLAAGLISALPLQYEQMLGRRFEGGIDLSGGEWQKLAIARAYLRDAQLLVLDEPTASLDARAEFEVFQRFSDLMQKKMAILISHRFSTVRMANRIVVLADGRIAEEGSHDQLMAFGRRYAEMFELQASSYR